MNVLLDDGRKILNEFKLSYILKNLDIIYFSGIKYHIKKIWFNY